MGCRKDAILNKYGKQTGNILIGIWMGDACLCNWCKATHYGDTFRVEAMRNKTIFWEVDNNEIISKETH